MADELTDKQQRFIAEYLIDFNGTRAAIAAGYSQDSASVIACENLAKPNIAAELDRRNKRVNDKLEVSQENVRRELARLAFHDPRKFYNQDGSLKPIPELDDDTAAALAGFEVEEAYEHFGKGQAKPKGQIKKIKTADKGQNLERLGRHLKMFTDKVESSSLDAIAEELRQARMRAEG